MGRTRTFVVAVVVLALSSSPAHAAIDSPFVQRISVNVPGDVAVAANTLQTCPATDPACAAAQRSGSANNNTFAMTQVDVDGDPSTLNSSRAALRLPADTEVLYAGLYWGGRTSAGTGGGAAPDPANRDRVQLAVPGAGYQAVTGTVAATGVAAAYAGRADVTGLVRGAGGGVYTVGGVQAGTGLDRYAGWSLVVAYRDAAQPVRNLTVYDGLATLQQMPVSERTLSLTVDGFQTPLYGPVRSTIGLVAYEGDRGSAGDSLTLNGTPLTDAANPANNVFNSTITDRGADVGGRDPAFDNQLGFDADRLGADGILPNGATSLTLAETTNVEQFFTQVVTLATDLRAPELAVRKRVTNVSRPGGLFAPGDAVRFTVDVTNTGQDDADDVTVRDPLPAGLTPVGGAQATAALGRLAPGATATATFDATIDAGTEGRTLTNVATATGRGASSGVAVEADSPPVTLSVVAPPPLPLEVSTVLTPSSPTSDDPVTGTVSITNPGPDPVPDVRVVVAVTGPAGRVVATSSQGTCAPGEPVVCSLGTIAPGTTVTARVRVVPASAGTIGFVTTVSSPGFQVAAARTERRVAAPRRLRMTKRASRRIARPGTRVGWTITTSVPKGAATARDVRVCDRLPAGLRLVAAPGARRRGARACWFIARLRPGSRRTLKLTTVTARGRTGRVVNTAIADAAGLRARQARATVRVVPATPSACGSTAAASGVPPQARAAC